MDFTTEFRVRSGFITLRIPSDYQIHIEALAEKCKAGFMSVKLDKPRKPRTTGEKSQNSCAWGYCQQIAQATGHEVYEIEYIAKVRAIKRGYPVTIGLGVPKSQADISVEECGYLIDEYIQIAAENNVKLKEV